MARALAALVLLASGPLGAAEDWREVARAEGVTVYAQERTEHPLPLLSAHTSIEASPYEIMAVIQDVGGHTAWMHDCVEARELSREGETVIYLYSRTDLPWPAADRDVVLRAELVVVEPGVELFAEVRSSGAVAVPLVAGVVRMQRLIGRYTLRAHSPTHTQVSYELDIDPGGRLPTWLVARTTRDIPLYTLTGLRRRVAETRGRYEAFLARWDPGRAPE